jgi:hypothetical protein
VEFAKAVVFVVIRQFAVRQISPFYDWKFLDERLDEDRLIFVEHDDK